MNYYFLLVLIGGVLGNLSAAEKRIAVQNRLVRVPEENTLMLNSDSDGNRVTQRALLSLQRLSHPESKLIGVLQTSYGPYTDIFAQVSPELMVCAIRMALSQDELHMKELLYNNDIVSLYASNTSVAERMKREQGENLLIGYMIKVLQENCVDHQKRYEEEMLAHQKTKRKNLCVAISMTALTVVVGFLGNYFASQQC